MYFNLVIELLGEKINFEKINPTSKHKNFMMKNWLTIGIGFLVIVFTTFGYAQDILFSAPEATEYDINFSSGQQTTYKDATGANQIIITSNRIISRSYLVHTISKETVRESSQYNVRGEYLLGFYKNGDSCKVLLEDDTYIFIQKDMKDLVGGTTKTFVKLSDKEFIIYRPSSNNKYRIYYIEIKGSKVIEHELDLDKRETIITINKKTEHASFTELNPSIYELKDLVKKSCFKEVVTYKR